MKCLNLFVLLFVLIIYTLLNVSCPLITTTSTYIDSFAMVDVPEITDFPMGWIGVAEPVHIVPCISPFKIGKYEVTRELLYTVGNWAKENNYIFKGEVTGDPYQIISTRNGYFCYKYEPVEMIFIDSLVWCNAYSEKEGYTPCYKLSERILSNYFDVTNDNNIVWDRSADGYRLPTEAEWEAAARYIDGVNWLPGDYASGATSNYLNEEETDKFVSKWGYYVPSDVGKKLPNHLGIYDMSGNIGEMCWDYSSLYTTTSPYTDSDPIGYLPENSDQNARVTRGGTLTVRVDDHNFKRSYEAFQTSYRTYRYSVNGMERGWWDTTGFRVVRRAKK